MKKWKSKVLAVLLTATLVLTSAGTAFAADTEQTAASDPIRISEDQAQKAANKLSVQNMTTMEYDKISCRTLVTGDESISESVIAYGPDSDYAVSGTNYYGISTPISFPAKGTVVFGIYAVAHDQNDSETASGSVYYGLYKDAGLSQAVDSYGCINVDQEDARVFKVPAAGTYYLGIKSYISTSSTAQYYGAGTAVAYIKGTDRTLTHKKYAAVGQKSAQTNYLKFKAPYSGYITVQSAGLSGKVTLTNSKKKALSNAEYTSTSAAYSKHVFGVTKGTTYYLKVDSNANYDGGYQIKYTNSKITEKSGTKKAKAVTIKSGATKKGYIAAGSAQADWYKFKLSKKKSVTITMKGATNDKTSITIYKGSKKVGARTFSKTTKTLTLKSSGKWGKGTYYIKINRGNSKSSGWYSVSWK